MTQGKHAGIDLRIPESIPIEDSTNLEGVRLLDRLIILVKWKSLIFTVVGTAILLAIGLSFLLKNHYTANTKLLPPQQGQSVATALLSQLGPLAGLAGGTVGIKNPSDIYITMLRSRTVEDALIQRFSLKNIYKAKLNIDAENTLRGATEIAADKDGSLTISVTDRDPQLAADIANAYTEELARLAKTLAVTEASKRRKFFEIEMNEANQQLSDAEVAMKQMQEKTGLILFDSQSRSTIQALASLRAQVAAKEVQIQAMQSYATPENPDLVRFQHELAALREQVSRLEGTSEFSTDLPIEKVPTAGLEYVRKYRDVKYHEALYELLAKQYEIARIDEARDSVLIQQMDKAVRPERKSGPHRLWIVISFALLSSIIAIFLAFLAEFLERAKQDSQLQSRFHLFRFYLRGKRHS